MKRIIRILSFFLALGLLYFFLDSILLPKGHDTSEPFANYYTLPPKTVDVLTIGSSHVGMNLDTSVLFDEYGIACYNLWSSMQPIWNSYYTLREGLKTQNPDVVVVELFRAIETAEYDEGNSLKNLLGMNAGLNKVLNAFVSFDNSFDAVEAIWGLPNYHDRYDELNEADFKLFRTADQVNTNQLDFDWVGKYSFDIPEYHSVSDTLPIGAKAEKYIYKIIELCKAQDIELLFLIAPYQVTTNDISRFKTIEKIAAEENIPVLNLLKEQEKYGINPQTDFVDAAHLNTSGLPKMARAVGDYLVENYSLQDRRKDVQHLWYGKQTCKEVQADYALDTAFCGDGVARYIDTDMRLYENKYASWTIRMKVEKDVVDDDGIYVSCYDESINAGLLVKQHGENALWVKFGSHAGVEVSFMHGELMLTVVKDVDTYTIYADGELIAKDIESQSPSHAGTVLIGCQEKQPAGEKFRFSQTSVMNLEIFNRIIDTNKIVGWIPQKLTKTQMPFGFGSDKASLVYTLSEQFMGNDSLYVQDKYIDTNMALYEEEGSRFTLLTRVTPGALSADNVFLSCFAEEENKWRGLLLRQEQNDELTLLMGEIYNLKIPCKNGMPVDIAIVKDTKYYTVYVNGMVMLDRVEISCSPYGGNLLIGCQETVQGEKIRYSSSRVNSLNLFSGVMTTDEIIMWDYSDAKLPLEREVASVNYNLESPYVGNGIDRYIDTNVYLYDDAQKAWTLDITIDPDPEAIYAVYVSCFSEEPGFYRGFMLRQDDAGLLNVYLGQLQVVPIRFSQFDEKMRIVVTKENESYGVFCNGQLIEKVQCSSARYDGSLLIGCQEDVHGEKMRFSNVKIEKLSLIDGAIAEEEALKLSVPSMDNNRFGER